MKNSKELTKRWVALVISLIILIVNVYTLVDALKTDAGWKTVASLIAIVGALAFGLITLKQIRSLYTKSEEK
ncbi:hypothetical protein [Catalinimonas alkaloidigena]|uniref:hypothetical protein n=1 Tax=Catalinimonas alkaloidigena TaxID=1075417 RepID=UPI002406A665|nr:hypothetical protein [Catalinimonas alkaloidigena]